MLHHDRPNFCGHLAAVFTFTVPKFAIGQSEAKSTVLISYVYQVTDLIFQDNAKFWAEFGYGKYLIVLFWFASATYQARLVLRLAKI